MLIKCAYTARVNSHGSQARHSLGEAERETNLYHISLWIKPLAESEGTHGALEYGFYTSPDALCADLSDAKCDRLVES